MHTNDSRYTWCVTAKLGSRKGASWIVDNNLLSLGRDPQCDITVRDPHVSRHHCRLTPEGNHLLCEDLGSRNATLVNGTPVKRYELCAGDEFAVGSAVFMVSRTLSGNDSQDTHSEELDDTISVVLSALESTDLGDDIHATPQSVEDLSLLHDFSLLMAESNTVDELADVTAGIATQRINGARALIGLLPKPGATSELYPSNIPIDESSRQSIEEALAQSPLEARFIQTAKSMNECIVPIGHGDRAHGVLYISWPKDPIEDAAGTAGFVACLALGLAPYLAERIGVHQVPADPAVSDDAIASQYIGTSRSANEIRRSIAMAARAELPVLLQGETGTGKEIAAQLMHKLSSRRDKPFIAVNCSSIPEELFEAEFFGFLKGSFTGADRTKKGYFASADTGVLFLDEVGELSPQNQTRLLRAVESGTFWPVGSESESSADVWIISAQNQNLLKAVKANTFRADLYYRLSGVEVLLPPLRNRRADIVPLMEFFASQLAQERDTAKPRFAPDLIEHMTAIPWHGNIRELRSVVRRIILMTDSPTLTLQSVEEFLPEITGSGEPHANKLQDVEREHIARVLEEYGGRIIDAADALGMHRNTLSRKMRKMGLKN